HQRGGRQLQEARLQIGQLRRRDHPADRYDADDGDENGSPGHISSRPGGRRLRKDVCTGFRRACGEFLPGFARSRQREENRPENKKPAFFPLKPPDLGYTMRVDGGKLPSLFLSATLTIESCVCYNTATLSRPSFGSILRAGGPLAHRPERTSAPI